MNNSTRSGDKVIFTGEGSDSERNFAQNRLTIGTVYTVDYVVNIGTPFTKVALKEASGIFTANMFDDWKTR